MSGPNGAGSGALAGGRVEAGEDKARRVWYVDLILGAWRPREAAHQLAADLGISLKPLHGDDPERAVMTTGPRSIDVEAASDPTIATAYDDAGRIAAELPAGAVVIVLTPRFGLPMRAENEWFFLYLRRDGTSVAAVGDEPPASEIGKALFERRRALTAPEAKVDPAALSADQHRILRFFPGLLPRALAERMKIDPAVAGLMPVGKDHFLIPVSWRDRDPRQSGRELDALSEVERFDDGLRALSQTFCTNYFADSPGLSELSRHLFLEGSAELARDLAERARLVARRPEDAALADLRRQEIRLYERRFAEMANAPEPSLRAPADLRDGLERLRSWGDMTTGNLTAAERRLAPLLTRLEEKDKLDPDELHVLNTLARARLDKRDAPRALTLAEAIADALERMPEPDRRIVFENAMTLASIHHGDDEEELHRAALDRAFATARGARTLAEVLEMNVLQANAEKDARSPAARLAWLRAALAWLAVEPSEGLARGAMIAVLGSDKAARAQLDFDMSEAIAGALDNAWAGLSTLGRDKTPLFRAVGGSTPKPAKVVGGPGAAVGWTPKIDADPLYVRPRVQLVRLVLAALAELSPQAAAISGGTVLVDTNLGFDIPRTREAALSAALRSGADEFAYGIDTIRLDEAIRPRLAADLRTGLSPIVHTITGDNARTTVTFRRHLAPLSLTGADARLLVPFRDHSRLTLSSVAELLGLSPADAEAALRRLEVQHIIRLDIEPR